VNLPDGDDRVGAVVGRDDQGLVLVVADDSETRSAVHFREVVLELASELRVGDVVDRAAEAVAISNHHPAALRAEVRVVVGSVEKISDTVIGRNNAEETTHPVSLSCLERS
jgi:predicted dinucleotide-utilizing enzyme